MTDTVKLVAEVQPEAVAVTVYVVVEAGETVLLVPVPKPPLHE